MSEGKAIHFIGIGGIGMSALARYFLAARRAANPERSRRDGSSLDKLGTSQKGWKWTVSGSDLVSSRITQELGKEGVKVKIGHKKSHITPNIDLAIYSQAVKQDNPELREAKRLSIPTLSYPEAIGELTRKYKTIAIAGAHGKSTTTALVALILKKAGFDPTIIIGTELKELDNKNFRLGSSPYLVLEADEFGRAFLHYSPTIAIVTNIDREHLDTYKNLAGVKKAFLKFLSNTKNGGVFVLNKDNKILASLSAKINKTARKNNCRILWYSVNGNTAKKIRKIIKIPGDHNISNAVAAYKVGRAFGVSHGKILSAIGSYRGSWRRMEYRGSCLLSHVSCRVYDDYAHHPTEIKATLKAFKEKYPHSPIICVFQPHQAKRLQALFKDFRDAFRDADILILIPMYQVAGRDKINPRFTSKTLATAIQKKYPSKRVFYLANPKKVKPFLSKLLHSKFYILNSGVIVMMGAGDIANYTQFLLR